MKKIIAVFAVLSFATAAAFPSGFLSLVDGITGRVSAIWSAMSDDARFGVGFLICGVMVMTGVVMFLANAGSTIVPLLFPPTQKRASNPEQPFLPKNLVTPPEMQAWRFRGNAQVPANGGIHRGQSVRGYVYFITSESGKCKIGKARDVRNRLSSLQTSTHEKLTVTYTIASDNPNGLEALLHHEFSSKRIHGEWFDLSPEDLEWVKKEYGVPQADKGQGVK